MDAGIGISPAHPWPKLDGYPDPQNRPLCLMHPIIRRLPQRGKSLLTAEWTVRCNLNIGSRGRTTGIPETSNDHPPEQIGLRDGDHLINQN